MLRVARTDLLRSWLRYYSQKGTAEALEICERHLAYLRQQMMKRGHRDLPDGLETLWGMAYGIHTYCRWRLRRQLVGG